MKSLAKYCRFRTALMFSFCFASANYTSLSAQQAAIESKPEETTEVTTPADELKQNLTLQLESNALPGLAMTLVKDEKIIFQESFGYANVAAKAGYTNSTIQPIGSISKTFIAVAVMKAIELEYFQLETEINDILPFNVSNPHSPETPITIKHLVTHSSGIKDDDDFYIRCYKIAPGADVSTPAAKVILNEGAVQGKRTAMAEMLEAYLSVEGDAYKTSNFLKTSAGEKHEYSNLASSLAAYLIECKFGKPYSKFVGEHIFLPLKMNDTRFMLDIKTKNNASILYYAKDQPLPAYVNDSYPDGSVQTSNRDLTKFMLEMIRSYHGDSKVLTKSSCDVMFSSQLARETPGLNGNGQGVFWVLNGSQVGHDGADPGVTAIMKMSMKKRSGILLMTNIDTEISEDSRAVANGIRLAMRSAFPLLTGEAKTKTKNQND